MADLSELDLELLECARYGELEDMVAQLDAGANLRVCDGGGNTALHRACANGHAVWLSMCAEEPLSAQTVIGQYRIVWICC